MSADIWLTGMVPVGFGQVAQLVEQKTGASLSELTRLLGNELFEFGYRIFGRWFKSSPVHPMRDWTKSALTDSAILKALTESDGVTNEESAAFADMLGRLEQRRQQALTPKQRQWAESVYVRLGLADEQGSENIASSGQVEVTDAERVALDGWTRSLGPKPLKPPGRR